jgi:4'-phosphopantetheinyl transferase
MHQLTDADFQPAQPPRPLGADEIHLWFFPEWTASATNAADSLPLRTLLGAYLDRDPAQLQITRAARGKPRLEGEPSLEFNLSHSGGALLVALSRTLALGVDLELPRRQRPVLELARRFFAPAEAAALAALPEARRQEAFLHLWTGKEAVLKALGHGIADGLDRIVLDIGTNGDVSGPQDIDLPPEPGAWHLVWLSPQAGALATVAWNGPECQIRGFTPSAHIS